MFAQHGAHKDQKVASTDDLIEFSSSILDARACSHLSNHMGSSQVTISMDMLCLWGCIILGSPMKTQCVYQRNKSIQRIEWIFHTLSFLNVIFFIWLQEIRKHNTLNSGINIQWLCKVVIKCNKNQFKSSLNKPKLTSNFIGNPFSNRLLKWVFLLSGHKQMVCYAWSCVVLVCYVTTGSSQSGLLLQRRVL